MKVRGAALLLLLVTAARSVSSREAELMEANLDGEDDEYDLANLEKVLLKADTKTDAAADSDDDSDDDFDDGNMESRSDKDSGVVAEDETERSEEIDRDKVSSANDGDDDDDDGDNGAEIKEALVSNKEKAMAQKNTGYIRHGHRIGLQTYVRNLWLSCAGSKCDRRSCPRMELSGSDWHRCWGEVFRIYRSKGPGLVRNGDYVGIYYPRQPGRWLGCPHPKCGKYACPGHPNNRFGFSSQSKWGRCGGEVFIIYARDRPNRAPIRSNDDVALYLARMNQWLSQCGGNTIKRTCLGRVRPPSRSKYDSCACETFTIVSRGKNC